MPAFLQTAIEQGLKIAFVGSFGTVNGHALMGRLGLAARDPSRVPARLDVDSKDALMGFEVPPQPDRRSYFPLEARSGRTLLRLKTERGESMDAAALMPWGGYVLRPYSHMSLPANRGERWVVDPIGFLRAALALPDMPVPDVTTENGRRLMMVHVDGERFVTAVINRL